MTSVEAKTIVKEFGGILDKKETLFVEARQLPHSKGMIKYAFFVYLASLVQDHLLKEELFEAMKLSYAGIDTYFVEGANEYNLASHNFKSGNTEEKAVAMKFIDSKGGFSVFMPSTEPIVELHNFVVECEGGW